MADVAVKRRTVTAPPGAGSDALLPAQRSRDKPIGRSLTWRRPHQVKENVQLRIEQQLLASLAHFVGIRTVSGDPHLHEDVFAGAKYLAGLLESVGMQVKLAQNVNTVHPCVLARLEVCPNLPTVVFYGHYDVFYVGDDVRLPAPPPPPPPPPSRLAVPALTAAAGPVRAPMSSHQRQCTLRNCCPPGVPCMFPASSDGHAVGLPMRLAVRRPGLHNGFVPELTHALFAAPATDSPSCGPSVGSRSTAPSLSRRKSPGPMHQLCWAVLSPKRHVAVFSPGNACCAPAVRTSAVDRARARRGHLS